MGWAAIVIGLVVFVRSVMALYQDISEETRGFRRKREELVARARAECRETCAEMDMRVCEAWSDVCSCYDPRTREKVVMFDHRRRWTR